jgi:hypothetical protein
MDVCRCETVGLFGSREKRFQEIIARWGLMETDVKEARFGVWWAITVGGRMIDFLFLKGFFLGTRSFLNWWKRKTVIIDTWWAIMARSLGKLID